MQISQINHSFQAKSAPQFRGGEDGYLDLDFDVIDNPSSQGKTIYAKNIKEPYVLALPAADSDISLTRTQRAIVEAGNLAVDPANYLAVKAFEKINESMNWLSTSQIAQIFTALAVFGASAKTGASAKVVQAIDNIAARIGSFRIVQKAYTKVAKTIKPISTKLEQVGTKAKTGITNTFEKLIEKPENREAFHKYLNAFSKQTHALASKLGVGSKQQAKRTVVGGTVALLASAEAGDRVKAAEHKKDMSGYKYADVG